MNGLLRLAALGATLLLASRAYGQNIDTFAGGGPDGLSAFLANMASPYGMVRDLSGNLLIVSAGANRILKLDTFGVVTVFAGNGTPGFAGNGGPARDASLDFPRGLAVDAAGNVYIADTNNHRIRRVSAATGNISTFAGTGSPSFGGDGGPAVSAFITFPYGLAFDSAGRLYMADSGNQRIRRVASGIITTVAGNGSTGSGGDGGPATAASLNSPASLALDSAGNLFIADEFNHRVRRVDGSSGSITTYAGTGTGAFSGDGGPAVLAQLSSPAGLSFDSSNNLYIADVQNHRVRRVNSSTGFISTVAGTGAFGFGGDGGPALGALLHQPRSVLAEASGDYLIGDSINARVRAVDGATANIDTLAGNGFAFYSGEGVPATQASFGSPSGVAVDGSDNVFVSAFSDFRIRRIDGVTGFVATVAGNGLSGDLGDGGLATDARLRTDFTTNPLALDGPGNLFFSQNDSHRVRRVDAGTGVISAYAGDGIAGFFGDGGPAATARLNLPSGLAVDASGNLYIADTANHRVRRVDGGTLEITTIAGNGTAGFSGDGGPAIGASLNTPRSLALDGLNHLYIGDAFNNRVRRVDLGTGAITTVAGNGSATFSGDGGPATSAGMEVASLAADAPGNLFIGSYPLSRVRFVDVTTGVITTIAGTGVLGFSGDGGPAVNARMYGPRGLALDSRGNLLIALSNNHRFRRVELEADFAISKDDGQTTAAVGGLIEYTIAVTNNGPGAASRVRVVDNVPTEILLPSFTPSQGAYDSGTGDWTGLNLGQGDSIYLTLSGTIDPGASGALSNAVSVSPIGGVRDSVTTNDAATDVDTLVQPAGLSVTNVVSPDPAIPGAFLVYDVNVANAGPAPATDVTLEVALPPDVTFQGTFPPSPTCDHVSGVVTCALGNFAVSQSALINVYVVADAAGTQVCTATVSADELELDYSNNTAVASSLVELITESVPVLGVTSKDRNDLLEWINPTTPAFASTEIVVNTVAFPTGPGDGTSLYNGGTAGMKDSLPHTGLTNGQTYYYAAFVHLTPSGLSPGTFTAGRPFDISGKVKWAHHTSATAMAPPSIGGGAVYHVSNDHAFHAMRRGAPGGTWPSGWTPPLLGAPAQSRSPIVPTTAVAGASRVAFIGAQDGYVYAIDADDGTELWQSAVPLGERVQGSPAGMFTAFPSGEQDQLFVGTRNTTSDNAFYTLNVSDGTVVGFPFDNGGASNAIGIVSSGASVDYVNDQVFFTSRTRSGGSSQTLWAFDITAGGLAYFWSWPLGSIDAAPVLHNGRLYVGTNDSKVYAFDPATAVDLWSVPFDCDDGPVKGFIWPDFGTNLLYFSTATKIWAISDDGGSATEVWRVGSIAGPSTPLVPPRDHYLFVGSTDGKLYQLDLSVGPPSITSIPLGDGSATVGSPSYDVPNGLIYVGSESGAIYAVQVPF